MSALQAGAPVPRRRAPRPLSWRIAALAATATILTAVLASGAAVALIRHSASSSARKTLVKLADAAQRTADDASSANAGQLRAREELAAINIQVATVSSDGRVTARGKLALDAARPEVVAAILAGESVSQSRKVNGVVVLIEARPTRAGGIILAQRRSDAVAVSDRSVRLVLVAVAGAVAVSIIVGLAVAVRIARPLRRTAAVAHDLATGHREVRVHPEGPAEIVEVAEALNMLSASLSASEARQREFLLAVSHDLRTPLTAITGYAESLADGMVTGEEVGKVGATMRAEAHRLERMIADLLDLARLEAVEFRVDVIEVELNSWLEELAQVWQARCAPTGVRFSVLPPSSVVVVHTDPARLRQLVDGLLENALRVTPAGAPIVVALVPGPVVSLQIRDGGPGLSESDLAVAFDRGALYERYRGVRQVGTGLGLAIVKALADRLGGDVQAGHAPEGGAQFTVWLPDVRTYEPDSHR